MSLQDYRLAKTRTGNDFPTVTVLKGLSVSNGAGQNYFANRMKSEQRFSGFSFAPDFHKSQQFAIFFLSLNRTVPESSEEDKMLYNQYNVKHLCGRKRPESIKLQICIIILI